MDEFLRFVADILECDRDEISMQTRYQDYVKWDSIRMICLIMETEERYGVNIPIERIENIKTLADLYGFVE